MKKALLIILPMLGSALAAHADEFYKYGGVQTFGTLPMVGGGIRYQDGVHGADLSTYVFPYMPKVTVPMFHSRALYLFYPGQSPFYIGAGAGCFNYEGFEASAETSLGYAWQFKNDHRFFLQLNGTVPFNQYDQMAPVIPGLTIGYGF